ncbi:MAG: hypothetical protein PVJ34_19940, partial [Anaerolineae bacterium]|jgi:hypothetical protein
MQPGVGHSPRYKATVWQVIFLAALGAPRTAAIDRACAYVLDHSRLPGGLFTAYASDHKRAGRPARGASACLNGSLLQAFLQLGYQDPRLEISLEALVDLVVGDRFCCRLEAAEPGKACAWGAVKALAAFAEVPGGQRSPAVAEAIARGKELFSGSGTGLASGEGWPDLSFPPTTTPDRLEALEVLGRLGAEPHPPVVAALAAVGEKQDGQGRWRLERTPENRWGDFGRIGRPNKWLTVRALRTFKIWEEKR